MRLILLTICFAMLPGSLFAQDLAAAATTLRLRRSPICSPNSCQVQPPAYGSAFVVATSSKRPGSYYLMTCKHVVEGANAVDVFVANQWVPGEFVNAGAGDPTDLALVTVSVSGELPIVPLAISDPHPGERVTILCRSPIRQLTLQASVHSVARDPRSHRSEMWIDRGDVLIQQGDSGSAVLDSSGNLVGVLSAVDRFRHPQRGLATPISEVRAWLARHVGWSDSPPPTESPSLSQRSPGLLPNAPLPPLEVAPKASPETTVPSPPKEQFQETIPEPPKEKEATPVEAEPTPVDPKPLTPVPDPAFSKVPVVPAPGPAPKTTEPASEPVIAKAAEVLSPMVLAAIAAATGGTGSIAIWGLGAFIRWCRRKPSHHAFPSHASQQSCVRPSPPAPLTVDSPPPPQAVISETHYTPYERDTFAEAHSWACDQIARKYPGAVATLEQQGSLIKQYLASKGHQVASR